MPDAGSPAAPFLSPAIGPRRHSPPGDRPFPARDGNSVSPLILAQEMYPDLERAVLAATETVYLAFRIFDPETRARSTEAKAAGLKDWSAILCNAVTRGVTVRLLLADFEPTVAQELHAMSWRAFRVLEAMAKTLSASDRERFEIIIAQHAGEVGWAWRQLLRLPVGLLVRKLIRKIAEEEADDPFDIRPGLWRYHRLSGGRPVFRRSGAPRLWPATHHHKFAVIDGRVAIIGGIDVNERRWETRRYNQRADETWHDISCRLEGPAVADAAAHFRGLWNRELPRYRALTKYWLSDAERELVVEPVDPIRTEPRPPAPAGDARVQLLRTLSRRSRQPFAFGPRAHVRELMRGYRGCILSARHFIYIEAQFFRHRRTKRWIAEAARRSPGLQVIVVMPQAPDEVAFGGERDNPAHRHGEWQQSRALTWLRRRLGDRLALISLAKRQSLTDDERQFVRDRGAVFGSGMIYVHSKLLIVDDRFAMISSANINNRSFHWDSEFGLLWEDAEGVQAMRRRLWGQLLGCDESELPAPLRAATAWNQIAHANITVAPEQRQGFVVPYQLTRARRFGRASWFVPDDLV